MSEVEKKGLTVVEGEKKYNVRQLTAKDTMTVGQMIAEVVGDQRIQNAVLTGEQSVIGMTIGAALLDRTPRKLALFCADMVGIADAYDLDEYLKKLRGEMDLETGQQVNVNYARTRMEDDIIEEIGSYPPSAYLDIMREIAEQDGIGDFLVSAKQLGTAMSSAFSKLQKPSKNGSASKTKKS